MQTSIESLSNGMKVVINPAPAMQTVGISLGVRYGMLDDPPRGIGISHYLEHMLFKGTKKRTWKEIDEEAKKYGIEKNAFTEPEYTVYIMRAYKGYLSNAMEILSDMIKNSTFPEKEVRMEKGPIVNEILIMHDNPASSDVQNGYLPKVLFKDHPARNSALENKHDTMKMTRRDLVRIYNSYYGPSNMVLSLYGGLTQRSGMELAKTYFGNFKRQVHRPERHPCREKQEKSEMMITRRGVKQTRIGIGFKTSEFRKPHMNDYLASLVTERLFYHRLFDEVREKRGLSYEPYAKSLTYSTYGFIAAEAGVEQRNLTIAKEVMLNEFKKLQNGEIERKELETVKNELRISYTTTREQTMSMSIWAAISEMTEGDATLPMKMPKLISQVSLKSVKDFCSRYIDVSKYSMYVLKPK